MRQTVENSSSLKYFRSQFKRSIKPIPIALACFVLLFLAGCESHMVGMLNPKGTITFEERKLFFDTLALMLIVVLPVIVMSFTFVYHYQVSHRVKDYKPNWGHSVFLESLWWGIPCAIIVVLAVLTWKSTHELDPYQRIQANNQPPLIIHAIALPWKWLFIYPEQGIATLNYLEIPVGRPVEYWLTADNVPMSAFFIPQLGSQIYAMAGMRTRLNLLATQPGVYDGMNTQFNGDGFSGMHFTVHVVSAAQMNEWITTVKSSSAHFTAETYQHLLLPSVENTPQFFADAPVHLFEQVIAVYMDTFGTTHPRAGTYHA